MTPAKSERKQLTVFQYCVYQHLHKHPMLNSFELAEDLQRSLTDMEDELNTMMADGWVKEEHQFNIGHVWVALE